MLKNENLAYYCIIHKGKIWLENETLPLRNMTDITLTTISSRVIGRFNDYLVYWLEADDNNDPDNFYSLRELLHIEPALFDLAGRAIQLSYMLTQQRYCGRCGYEAQFHDEQLAMQCQTCKAIDYPRVSPCIIVAVRKNKQILLAQHPRHKTGMYTVIAGFVETGETLEQCVAREVLEETGITVANIQYFASQPWAFPSNLMMGFTADYAGGDIKPDYEELTDAIWADVDHLPQLPPQGTIARRLIDHTLSFSSSPCNN
ncbi:NADH pyrophosphatase [Photobacterium sp. SKA34]|uniref:NAD(+) diphosphatase n=1 Tax=Photobacterium sp. SKA34 TaxID=121723 RepID=UPI00006BF909|nr:NAD(+) diphosphatase [Photobacterium sp. SKA34]EAR54491.1 NADH pyrophosphatase [Photobacterium sp. SKA34]